MKSKIYATQLFVCFAEQRLFFENSYSLGNRMFSSAFENLSTIYIYISQLL